MDLAIIDATVAQQPPLSAPESSRYATPIANVPLIRHVLDELAASGIARATIVTHPAIAGSLHRILGGNVASGVEIVWAETGDVHVNELLLAEVERALDSGPVLLHPGDSLFREQMRKMAARFESGDVDSVLPAQAAVPASPSPKRARVSDTAIMLGPAVRPVLETMHTSDPGEASLIEVLLHSDCRLAVCATGEHWTYGDTTAELLAANRMLLDSIPASRGVDRVSDGNEIHGRVSISPSASVSSSVIHGPVAIDADAVIEDSFIGPYTAIGAGVVVRGAEIDNTMVHRGAEISHPDCRLEGSIIGERCRITRSFSLPRGMHVRLGPDSHIALS